MRIFNRKIIQITGDLKALYALCDDGTLWGLFDHVQWTQLPAVPPYDLENTTEQSA